MNNPIPKLSEADLARFWSKVNKRFACWRWTGTAHNKTGYGSFNIQGKQYQAHRVAYFVKHGVDPGDKYVCHSCDITSCCNPAHLFLGTNADNMRDMVEKGRSLKGTQHDGAKLTEEEVLQIRSSDKTQRVLALWYEVSQQEISCIQRGQSWKHVGGKRQNKGAKLTEQNVREILASNEKHKVLAACYGVSLALISSIKRGKRWGHIYAEVNG